MAPTSATTKVSAAARDRRQPWVGTPAWLIASLPHGKPPHGQRSLNASAATHQPATASGHQRRLSSSRCAIANTAKMSAEAIASATQANQARLMTQATSGKKKARPKTRPTVNAPRSERPDRATTSSAWLTTASGHAPPGVRGRQQQAGDEADQQRPAHPQRRPGRRRAVGRADLAGRDGLVKQARYRWLAWLRRVLRVRVGLPWDHSKQGRRDAVATRSGQLPH